MHAILNSQKFLRSVVFVVGIGLGIVFENINSRLSKTWSDDYQITGLAIQADTESISVMKSAELALESFAKSGRRLPPKGSRLYFEIYKSDLPGKTVIRMTFMPGPYDATVEIRCFSTGEIISHY